MDKITFGQFIKQSRNKKEMTQKQLADLLFIDVTAVSKWERGITYHDITLIPEICKHLEINEHELIACSNDTEYRNMKSEAEKYKKLKNILFCSFSLCYITAVVICFIVNLCVSHNLSWFFIVFTSCLCGFCFVPGITRFFQKYKFSVYVFSSFFSLIFLYLSINIYTKSNWFFTAVFGTFLGYFLLTFPIIFSKQKSYLKEKEYKKLKKFFLLIYSVFSMILTIILLSCVNRIYKINLQCAIGVCIYCFAIFIFYAIVEIFNINRFLRLGIDFIFSGFHYFGLAFVLTKFLGETQIDYYKVNYFDWKSCVNGNVAFLILGILGLFGISFIIKGIISKNEI